MIPAFRVDVAELHAWNRKNRLARLAYAAEQGPRPSMPRLCIDCGTPTRARDQRCNDCQRKP